MSGSSPHSTQQPNREQIIAAFKAWAMADDGDPASEWRIDRQDARRLFEQLEAERQRADDWERETQLRLQEGVGHAARARELQEQLETAQVDLEDAIQHALVIAMALTKAEEQLEAAQREAERPS